MSQRTTFNTLPFLCVPRTSHYPQPARLFNRCLKIVLAVFILFIAPLFVNLALVPQSSVPNFASHLFFSTPSSSLLSFVSSNHFSLPLLQQLLSRSFTLHLFRGDVFSLLRISSGSTIFFHISSPYLAASLSPPTATYSLYTFSLTLLSLPRRSFLLFSCGILVSSLFTFSAVTIFSLLPPVSRGVVVSSIFFSCCVVFSRSK